MTHRYIKIGITAFVLVAAFGGLMWTTLQDGTEYYKHVDEVMSNPAQWEGKAMQLHGFVVPGSILQGPRFVQIPVQAAEQRQRRHAPRTKASCPTRSRTNPKSC